jgi:hypothetical protein
MADPASGALFLYENTGGSFSPPRAVARKLSGGRSSHALATGDFDGDGDVDIAIAFTEDAGKKPGDKSEGSEKEAKIALLENRTPTPSKVDSNASTSSTSNELRFGSPEILVQGRSFSSQPGKRVLYSSDIGGGEAPDLAYGIKRSGEYGREENIIEWVENKGDGSFAEPERLAKDRTASALRVMDVDEDGNDDLLVAGERRLYWLKRTSSNSFSEPKLAKRFGGSSIRSLEVVNLDSDEKPEVVIGLLRKAVWVEPDAEGKFSDPTVIGEEFEDISRPISADVSDLDSDGSPDVIIGTAPPTRTGRSENASQLFAYRNKGNGRFSSPLTLSDSLGIWSIDSKDFDGDDAPDILSVFTEKGEETTSVGWLSNRLTAEGDFSSVKILSPLGKVNSASAVATVDLDGDGDKDVLSTSQDDGVIQWHQNRGNGRFFPPAVMWSEAEEATAISHADLDGDGDSDVVVASKGEPALALLENKGESQSERFAKPKSIAPEAEDPTSVQTADLDGDGTEDILWNHDHQGTYWARNTGSGKFGDREAIIKGESEVDYAQAADIDGDGDLDVITGGKNVPVRWHENTGGGTFSNSSVISSNIKGARLAATADLDEDGDLDIVVEGARDPSSRSYGSSNIDNVLVWYKNKGGGSFSKESVIGKQLPWSDDLVISDVDGDGLLDIVGGRDKLTIYKQSEAFGNTTFEKSATLTSELPSTEVLSFTSTDLIQGNQTESLVIGFKESIWWMQVSERVLGSARSN